jgi:SPP1 gp7 family putative phage head morphogenesis protein
MSLPRDTAVQQRLGDLLARHMAAANLLGRTQIVQDVHRKTGKVVPIATSSRFRQHHHKPRNFAEDGGTGDTDLSLGFSLDLPADDAADYLRGLTPVTKETYDGLTAQYRRDAFTVAGVSDQRLIQKIRDELAQIIQDGGTRQDFEAAVRKLTSEAGVQQLNAFTLDTVFTTNMQKAYSLGRYEQMKEPATAEALPFWQYMTVGDDRVRPEHAVIDGFQARVADPVWNRIYPPNGFNCRCIVIALLASEAGDAASEPGYARLPLLAQMKVPQQGFTKVFPVAA